MFIFYLLPSGAVSGPRTSISGATGFGGPYELDSPRCVGDGLPATYTGKLNRSYEGYLCQKWTDQTPWEHDYTPSYGYSFVDQCKAGLGDHNYCRAPYGRSRQAWCYTSPGWKDAQDCDCLSDDDTSYWGGYEGEGYENYPLTATSGMLTDEEKLDCENCNRCGWLPIDYTGTVNVAKGGWPCRNWTDQSGDGEAYEMHEKDPAHFGNHNYCRAASDEQWPANGAWCYIVNPDPVPGETQDTGKWAYCGDFSYSCDKTCEVEDTEVEDTDVECGECSTANEHGECVLDENANCYALECNPTNMVGSISADILGVDGALAEALVNDETCSGVTYNEDDQSYHFDIALGDCNMLAESVEDHIKFTIVIGSGVAAEPVDGIYLSSSFGSTVTLSCSYSDVTSTNAVEYQVSTMTNGYAIDQLTQWADLSLAFFSDETFVEAIADQELAIGTPVFMQVMWEQTFGPNFPVEFYVSDCVVSDNDGNEYKVIDAGCGDKVVDTTLMSGEEGYSKSQAPIQYEYNSFSFTDEQTTAQQTVTCTIKFCLQEDIASGDCGFDECA